MRLMINEKNEYMNEPPNDIVTATSYQSSYFTTLKRQYDKAVAEAIKHYFKYRV